MKKKDIQESSYLPAGGTRRIVSFLLDTFISTVIKSFLAQALFMYWIQRHLLVFVERFKLVFGSDVKFTDVDAIHIRLFTDSPIFPRMVIFSIIMVFAVGFLYNFIFGLTKWSATPGQKMLRLKVVKKNGDKARWYNILVRSILLMLPWFYNFFIITYQIVAQTGFFPPLAPSTFLLAVALPMLIWYDTYFITANKQLMHDILSGTKVIDIGLDPDEPGRIYGWMDRLNNFVSKKMEKNKKK